MAVSNEDKGSDPFFPSIRDTAERIDLATPEEGDASSAIDRKEGQDESPIQEIDSLCMTCGEQGRTRMLLTAIPYFKEVIVMSFQCEHCGATNNDVQSASAVRDRGVIYTLKALERDDLNRQIVKSSSCTVAIPEFQLTIPPGKGQITTVEGILRDTVVDLRADQPLRRIQDEKAYAVIDELLRSLSTIIADSDSENEQHSKGTRREDPRERLEQPIRSFTLTMDDPAGNSFLEFRDNMADPQWAMRQYNRTREQNELLGFATSESEIAKASDAEEPLIEKPKEVVEEVMEADEEIFVFPGVCSSCRRPLNTMMKKVVIPYFKDIIIMSTNCSACGYRDNEVKSGGVISKRGKKITLKVQDAEDLGRDILKSETCGFQIPEIGLQLEAGTLGGRFTTLEGILTQVYDELSGKVFLGDSSEPSASHLVSGESDAQVAARERGTFSSFLGNLKTVIAAERSFTVILDDPLANSYLQNLNAPDDDPNMTVETYERTFQQNEDLGLNDIKVDNYEENDHRQS